MLQLHAGEDGHFTCTSHLTEIVKEQKYNFKSLEIVDILPVQNMGVQITDLNH